MKKIKAVALFSTAILATASTGVYADELISDGTTSPSTEQVTPSTDTSSEIVIPDDGSTTPSTDTGSNTEPTVPVDPTTPSTSDNTGEDSSTVPGTSEEDPSTPSTEPTTDPTDQSGTVDVPTTDGGTSTVTPDTSVPTNNPNISAETAAQAGASQVGTTSQVTGQVVQDVTSEAPVYTNTGATIVSTQDGSVVLADGTITTPEAIGATTNSDGTISVTTSTGESTTLPMTGDTDTTLLSVLGTGILGFVGFLWKKKKMV